MKLPLLFRRPELGFDLLRIYLGVGLFVRGVLVAQNPAFVEQFIGNDDWLFPMLVAHAVVLTHTVGGLLLALGCYTRWAAAVQLPLVGGALFFVHWQEGLFTHTQSFEFSALVLFVLSVYATCGAARLSVDHYLAIVRPEPVGFESVYPFRAEPVSGARAANRVPLEGSAPAMSPALDQLPLPVDPPAARAEYRDLKQELTIGIVILGVLAVLLGLGQYVLAPVWLIATGATFIVWRIGRTHFEGE
jgi:putative oxidoreductase